MTTNKQEFLNCQETSTLLINRLRLVWKAGFETQPNACQTERDPKVYQDALTVCWGKQ